MFGKNLRNARKLKGYTLEELSDIYNKTYSAGMNKGTLSKYENEKQEPLITVVANLAALLDVPVDYLLDTDKKKMGIRAISLDFTAFEQKLVFQYRNADDLDKKMVCRILHLNNEESKFPEPKETDVFAYPDHSDLEPVAAHERTDIEVTEDMRIYDDDIMDDDDFWK